MKADRFADRPLAGPAVGGGALRQADPAHPGLVRRRASPSSAGTRSSSTRRLTQFGRRRVARGHRPGARPASVAAIVLRTYGDERIDEMAAGAGVPVVNALTDGFHPCQLLADLLTVRERCGALARADPGLPRRRRPTTWPTPTCSAGATAGMHVRVAGPAGFEPDPAVVARADRDRRDAPAARSRSLADPVEAVRGRRRASPPTPGCRWARRATAATGTAVPAVPGQRRAARAGRGRTRSCCTACPAHRGEEITDEVHRRAAERRVRRGREPAARAEGAADLAAGPARRTRDDPGRPIPMTGAARRGSSTLIRRHARSARRPSWPSCSPPTGVAVTQATLSRDLEELGAVKVRGADGARRSYADPARTGTAPAARRPRRRPSPAGPAAAASCSPAPTPAATSSCCAPRRAPRSSSPARSTGPSLPDDRRHHRRRRHHPGGRPASRTAGARPRRSRLAGLAGRQRTTDLTTQNLRRSTRTIMTERVVLAYSGGLDTSVAIR